MTTMRDNALSHYHDLLKEIREDEGCPVCSVLQRNLYRYVEAINYEAVNDPGFRQSFMQSGGFCHDHAWLWQERTFLLGTASLYHELLDHMQPAPTSVHAGGWRSRLFHESVDEQGGCPLCDWTETTETALVRGLLESLADDEFASAYGDSFGMCGPHIARAAQMHPQSDALQVIESRATATEDKLSAELAEIIRKHDYRYAHEPTGEEKGAASRAIAHLVGARERITGR